MLYPKGPGLIEVARFAVFAFPWLCILAIAKSLLLGDISNLALNLGITTVGMVLRNRINDIIS